MRNRLTGAGVIAWTCVAFAGAQSAPAARPDLSGSWALNADQSDHPQTVGFTPDASGTDSVQPRGGGQTGGGGSNGGGFGGRGGGRGGGYGRGGGAGLGGGGFGGAQAPRENTDDRLRTLELSDEVRNPSATLNITEHDGTVTIVDAENNTRVFHPTGKKDTQPLSAVKVDTRTTWEGSRLVTDYDVGSGRKIRYTYSLVPDSKQLLVEVVFDAGSKQSARTPPPIKRIYDAAPAAAR